MAAPLVAAAIEPTVAAIYPSDDKTAKGLGTSTSSLSSYDENNPFSDPKVAQHYRELYEASGYESRSAFDPDLEWTQAEEKRIIRKLDWHVCAFACLAFFALQVDRGNLSQAAADNLYAPTIMHAWKSTHEATGSTTSTSPPTITTSATPSSRCRSCLLKFPASSC